MPCFVESFRISAQDWIIDGEPSSRWRCEVLGQSLLALIEDVERYRIRDAHTLNVMHEQSRSQTYEQSKA